MPPAVPRVSLVCSVCRTPFERREKELNRHEASGTYCSRECRGFAKRRRIPLACEDCGRPFERAIAEAAKHRHAFCSRECLKRKRAERATSYKKLGGVHEHRIIGARMVGRPLLPDEIVHHKDENKRNNAPDNLKVMDRREHARLHNTNKYVSPETRRRLSVAAVKRYS